MAGNVYSIKKNRFKRALVEGFAPMMREGRDGLVTEPGAPGSVLCLRGIDGIEDDKEWGRLWFEEEIPDSMVCYVHALAVNEKETVIDGKLVSLDNYMTSPEISRTEKKAFFENHGGLRFVDKNDMLLYKLKGRYLYLLVEVTGIGIASLWNIRVDSMGDNFISTFPEVYGERDAFFHRFLSVFSSIYNDFGEDIASLPKLLDVSSCPGELLPLYGEWMGIDTGSGFLKEEVLRTLVSEAYELNRIKGTKRALKRVADILLEDNVYLLENNVIYNSLDKSMLRTYSDFQNYDGESITLLTSKLVDDNVKSGFLFILDQFKPVRTTIRLVELRNEAVCNRNCYLDVNACLRDNSWGRLDSGDILDGTMVLS